MHQFHGLKPVPANLVELMDSLERQQFEASFNCLSQDPVLALYYFILRVDNLTLEQDFTWSDTVFSSHVNPCASMAISWQGVKEPSENDMAFYRYSLEAAYLAQAIACLNPQKVPSQWAYYCALLAAFAHTPLHELMPELKSIGPYLSQLQSIPLFVRQAWQYQAELDPEMAAMPALTQLVNVVCQYVRKPHQGRLPDWFRKQWQLGDEVLSELYQQVQAELAPLFAADKFAQHYQHRCSQVVYEYMDLQVLQANYESIESALEALGCFCGTSAGQLWAVDQGRAHLLSPCASFDPLNKLHIDISQSQSVLAQSLREGQSQALETQGLASLGLVERQVLEVLEHDSTSSENNTLLFLCGQEAKHNWVWVALVSAEQSARCLKASYRHAAMDFINRHLALGQAKACQPEHLRALVHEVGNPLTVVSNYLAGLKLELNLSGDALVTFGKMESELNRAQQLLRGVEVSSPTTSAKPCDLNAFLRDSVQMFKASFFTQQGVELTLELDDALEPLLTDENKLQQILSNLLKNAAENLSAGDGVVLRSRAGVLFGGKNYYLVELKDTGHGLPESVKQRLLEATSANMQNGNQGLGLTIVRQLVEELGGMISYQDNQPSGCCFQLYLAST